MVGKIVALKEVEKGLWFKAKISNTTLGRDLIELINDEAINELSIGYRAVVWEIDDIKNVRKLKEVMLYEISFVSRAANPQAVINNTEVKSDVYKTMTDEDLLKIKSDVNKEIEIRIVKQLTNILKNGN